MIVPATHGEIAHEQRGRYSVCAIQGAEGSFSEIAARHFLGGDGEVLFERSFKAALDALRSGRADCAALPVLNLIAGPVQAALEAIIGKDAAVVGDHWVPVQMQLIGVPGAQLSDIRRVISHPVALQQCRKFLASLPGVTQSEASDTASSVREIIAAGDRASAAIAGEAALIHGGVVLAKDIQDAPNNATRFLMIARKRESFTGNRVLMTATAGLETDLRPSLDPLLRSGMTLHSEWHTDSAGKRRYLFELSADAADPAHQELVERWRASEETHRILGWFQAESFMQQNEFIRTGQ